MTIKYNGEKVTLSFEHYANGRRALRLLDSAGWTYTVITKNIDAPISNGHCAFIDTNNNPKVKLFLQNLKLGHFTGVEVTSGFCTYPEFEFDCEAVNKYSRM